MVGTVSQQPSRCGRVPLLWAPPPGCRFGKSPPCHLREHSLPQVAVEGVFSRLIEPCPQFHPLGEEALDHPRMRTRL